MTVRWARTTALAATALLGSSVISCKKKEEAPPAPSAAPAPEPPKAEVKDAGAKNDEVKRYDDEQKESGTVRIAIDRVRVHVDTDPSSKLLTTLNRGTLVNRLARKGNFLLIEYPSGVGQLSPGWILAVQASTQVEKVDPEAVKNQKDAAAPAPTVKADAAVPAPTAKADAAAAAPTATPDAGAPKPPAQPDAGAAAPRPRPGRLKLPDRK